jgi:hypothetical protein
MPRKANHAGMQLRCHGRGSGISNRWRHRQGPWPPPPLLGDRRTVGVTRDVGDPHPDDDQFDEEEHVDAPWEGGVHDAGRWPLSLQPGPSKPATRSSAKSGSAAGFGEDLGDLLGPTECPARATRPGCSGSPTADSPQTDRRHRLSSRGPFSDVGHVGVGSSSVWPQGASARPGASPGVIPKLCPTCAGGGSDSAQRGPLDRLIRTVGASLGAAGRRPRDGAPAARSPLMHRSGPEDEQLDEPPDVAGSWV